ncbi:glycosyltransferase family 39 protein [Leptolyngbya sp. NIES-2104]|uniref:glycosyltransferase family 39 protein n=1 Tax=Leptolyngbya sp. NIES-2104 TaxID=1552121 RepID=UPI0006ECC0A3|nr:glycosyltransferase family 39 protein [Leptolyngbya sp. NIES-2104]GAP94090.1 glycosyltransferase of PMT family [Leptolyngbya sp. NIES-2104]
MIAKQQERRGVKKLAIVAGIWAIGMIIDRIWFAVDQSVPAWDQAEYLTGAMNFWRAFQTPDWFSQDWWTSVWMLSSKMPPLVYLTTAPFIHLFGAGEDRSTLVNLLYSAILLGSVYGLAIRLFNLQVAVWSLVLCLLLPGLYVIRLDYLIDFPLVAIVTLTFFCLTLWATETNTPLTNEQSETVEQPRTTSITQSLAIVQTFSFPNIRVYRSWFYVAAFGISLGLSFLCKQPALFFLLTPIVWLGVVAIRKKAWRRLIQLLIGIAIAGSICLPWYRTNWLIILTAGRRATIDSAIAEGDPPLTSLYAWTYYFKALPALVSVPLFVVGLVGLLLYWKRSVIQEEWEWIDGRWIKTADYGGLGRRGYRREIYDHWSQSVRWLLIFLVGAYILCSANVNKDDRYITPLLPVLAILLAQGLLLFPDRLRIFRWGAIVLSTLLMVANLLPVEFSPRFLQTAHARHAVLSGNWHQTDVVNEIISAEPYLQSTIGVLPSLPEFNQHNLNYAGTLRNFQVYGRQVGADKKQIEPDSRSLSWYVTKTGNGGAIRRPEAYNAVNQTITNSPDFQLQQSWKLPDKTELNLYRRSISPIQVAPNPKPAAQVRLEQIRIPNQAAPGKPLPITYRWSGSWEQLNSGLLLLTWTRVADDTTPKDAASRWFHDHAIALGTLHSPANPDNASFQVTERLAALPPANAQGTYTLTTAYLNRETGATYAIDSPDVRLTITSTAEVEAPELDALTQLRTLAATMPQGIKALDRIFAKVGQLNQYDPNQDYITQTRQILEYRSQQEPNNLEFAYGVALSNVLKRRVQPAIDALERVTQLDAKNPAAHAYLAFVNLYDFRPGAAQKALNTAIALDPNQKELRTLNAVAGLMRGNLVQAWTEYRRSQS